MSHRRVAHLGAVGLVALIAGCGSVPGASAMPPEPADMTMVNVVKVEGIAWFDRMASGDEAFATRTGVNVRQEGADDTSAQKQVQLIEDVIATHPTAITVVPNSPEALEPVLGRARAMGIKVVTHEATGIRNADIDIEAFDNGAFGRQMMQSLAECMGGHGRYVQFLGSVTAKTHMQWVNAAHDLQLAQFPGMTRVADPMETNDDEQVAYQKAKDILVRYPDVTGFQGSSSSDGPGIARAVREAGRQDQVCVMSTSIPSAASEYLADGSMDRIFFWDPALAGEAQLQIALMLAQGTSIAAGTDLGVPGYESLTKLDGYDNVYVGNAALQADAETVSQYDF